MILYSQPPSFKWTSAASVTIFKPNLPGGDRLTAFGKVDLLSFKDPLTGSSPGGPYEWGAWWLIACFPRIGCLLSSPTTTFTLICGFIVSISSSLTCFCLNSFSVHSFVLSLNTFLVNIVLVWIRSFSPVALSFLMYFICVMWFLCVLWLLKFFVCCCLGQASLGKEVIVSQRDRPG